MASYLSAILPNLLSRRTKVPNGVFWMKGMIGIIVNAVACLFMLAFIVIFCFPVSILKLQVLSTLADDVQFAMPVEIDTMSTYTDLLLPFTC